MLGMNIKYTLQTDKMEGNSGENIIIDAEEDGPITEGWGMGVELDKTLLGVNIIQTEKMKR